MEVCERLIGPIPVLAEVAGINPKSPYGWRHASSWREAGQLPPKVNTTLLAYADRHQLGLTADHLIRGADAAQIDAILMQRREVAA